MAGNSSVRLSLYRAEVGKSSVFDSLVHCPFFNLSVDRQVNEVKVEVRTQRAVTRRAYKEAEERERSRLLQMLGIKQMIKGVQNSDISGKILFLVVKTRELGKSFRK